MKPVSETVKGVSASRWTLDVGRRIGARVPAGPARASRTTECPPGRSCDAGRHARLRVRRVLGVVAGVDLATLFVPVMGSTWWSLGPLVAASLLLGQVLQLGPNLVEVPISAMLVLGIGAAGADTVGTGPVVETLIGATVGVAINPLFPPAVRTRHAGHAVEGFVRDWASPRSWSWPLGPPALDETRVAAGR
jgi:hypothetical protein